MTTVVASSNLKIVELNRKIAALQSHNEELQQYINAHETWCPTALSVIKNVQDDLMLPAMSNTKEGGTLPAGLMSGLATDLSDGNVLDAHKRLSWCGSGGDSALQRKKVILTIDSHCRRLQELRTRLE